MLAANTAFADFPRLSSILSRDGYMPRQFAARGDRLAFSNGIIVLALVAMLLVWTFRGNTSALIPLYAIGVFICFSLSQTGMVIHWLRTREEGWRWKALLNGVGAVATALVSIVQVVTKFTTGAWIVVVIIPLIILMLRKIHGHYATFREETAYTGHAPLMFLHHTVVVAVNGITSPSPVHSFMQQLFPRMSGRSTSRWIQRAVQRLPLAGKTGISESTSRFCHLHTGPSSVRSWIT